MKLRLGHVCLGTPRLDEMTRFYCEHFDARIVHEFLNDAEERYGVFLEVGEGSYLELFHDESDRGSTARFRHFAFEVDDIEAWARRFHALGQHPEIRRGRTDGALGCWVQDPDENPIELHQYDEASVQGRPPASLVGRAEGRLSSELAG